MHIFKLVTVIIYTKLQPLSQLSLPRCDFIYWQTKNYNNVPATRFQEDQFNCFKTTNIYTLMQIKLTYILMLHTYMYKYNPAQHCYFRKINVTSALSWVASALHREDVTAVVGFLVSKKGRTVNEHDISVANTNGKQMMSWSSQQLSLLLPSQQPRRYYRWNGHDTTGRSQLYSTSSKSCSTPFSETRNAFHVR